MGATKSPSRALRAQRSTTHTVLACTAYERGAVRRARGTRVSRRAGSTASGHRQSRRRPIATRTARAATAYNCQACRGSVQPRGTRSATCRGAQRRGRSVRPRRAERARAGACQRVPSGNTCCHGGRHGPHGARVPSGTLARACGAVESGSGSKETSWTIQTRP